MSLEEGVKSQRSSLRKSGIFSQGSQIIIHRKVQGCSKSRISKATEFSNKDRIHLENKGGNIKEEGIISSVVLILEHAPEYFGGPVNKDC